MNSSTGRTATQHLAQRWGESVAARRSSLGITQTALAEACGVTQQAVSKVEAGHSIPSDPLKLALAAALDIAPGDLFAWPAEVAS